MSARRLELVSLLTLAVLGASVAPGCGGGAPPLPAPTTAAPTIPLKALAKVKAKKGVSKYPEEDGSFHLRKAKDKAAQSSP